ncbi:HD-GYP domain-containing protein [Paenibacillus sacheonensis]|uniref:HD domain-containing protein n=1 Tax=Paenibacillus sacheonensis TaxID=742054 RepID=A0A7X4YU69_9BACL|nr:HD-GYP domain-containing protein [Paenibacillus sacheonensis]MBM7568977.1 HD-GYP domain-containing protein (c-di-GMP phosphodiesterase class II) [Paenibacillus sacheonensis]NBC72650.1 HD domain-containing protein [Paenibacillus sacheonensis]
MQVQRSIMGPILAVVLPIALFEWFRSDQAADMTLKAPQGHFIFVTLVAALATVVAVAVGITGQRLRNIKVGFMSLAYMSLAGVFLLHGLTTPGFVIHSGNMPAMFAQLSILLTSLWLCLSSVSSDYWLIRRLSEWRQWLLPAWVLLLALLGAYTFWMPHEMGMLPINSNPYKWVAVGITCTACLWTMYRYWQSYQHAGFPLQRAIVYSVSLILAAQYIIVEGTSWHLSWWLYHLLLLGSMLVMLVGLIRQYFSRGSFSSSLRVLFQSDPRAWLEACKTPSVKALIMATEARDAYTAGHNNRVALYALRLGEEMKLTKDELRAIAQGGVVHDVGKLKVPDAILNKAGKLTQEERLIIERHPISGYDMCKQLGFLGDELSVIRSHHEKWDGTGYPDRLSGETIPLLARVTAVADVYDALTSSRSYRQAMSHEEAMAIIVEGSGVHFCPACVKAWQRLAAVDAEFFAEIAASSRSLRLVHRAVQ